MIAQDVGRLVVQCACERTGSWRGEDAAIEAGWHRRWMPAGDDLVPAWCCPDCYEPPAPPAPAAGFPAYLEALVLTGDESIAREQLALMREWEHERFAHVLAEIEGMAEWMLPKSRRRRWAAWAKQQRERKTSGRTRRPRRIDVHPG